MCVRVRFTLPGPELLVEGSRGSRAPRPLPNRADVLLPPEAWVAGSRSSTPRFLQKCRFSARPNMSWTDLVGVGVGMLEGGEDVLNLVRISLEWSAGKRSPILVVVDLVS